MAGKKEEFDFLGFYIFFMLLLSVIVGGFAVLNRREVAEADRLLRREVRFLEEMGRLARDEDFRALIAKSRQGSAGVSGSTADFQALYIKLARDPQHRLQLENHSLLGSITHPDGEEFPFQLVIKQCRVEELVRYLVKLEETWPGARVKKITKLQYVERGDRKGWDATVVVSVFRSNET
ncbi:MAG: hypothetical protein D6731_20790 [Planctomycetota bacterium]|nr:MAG: hypothetical protein D6731_20790 [Planctomycetota bacterium]